MAKECVICKKGSVMVQKRVKLRGKYNPTAKYRSYPNLQKVQIPADLKNKKFKDFAGKKVLACTKCIKAIGKTK
jgi:ribosomal protein L28